jgi:uncharacterized membrane protein
MPTGYGRADIPTAKDGSVGATLHPAAAADPAADDVRLAPAADRRLRSVATNRVRRAMKAKHAAERTWIQRTADLLTAFASSTPFLLIHVVWFAVWIAWNVGLFRERPFDPFPFGLLTMVVSLEAIFLSIFVLMAQSREAQIAELREEIMLQVNLRMEEEVTKTLQLVAGLYTRLGYRLGDDPELSQMLQPLDADEIERNLTAQIHEGMHQNHKREP